MPTVPSLQATSGSGPAASARAPRRRCSRSLLLLASGATMGAIAVAFAGATPHPPDGHASELPATDAARLAYGVGYDLGRRAVEGITADGLAVDAALLERGFADAVHGRPSAVPERELDRVMRAVHREMLERAAKRRMAEDAEFRKLAEESLARSRQAIEAFAAKPGVKQAGEGVHYQVLASGDGAAVGPDDLIVVDYRVTLSDGSELDRGQGVAVDPDDLLPATGRLLRTMKVGDRWSIAMAPEAAYGLGGDPPRLGPNEALFAEVALTAVKKEDER